MSRRALLVTVLVSSFGSAGCIAWSTGSVPRHAEHAPARSGDRLTLATYAITADEIGRDSPANPEQYSAEVRDVLERAAIASRLVRRDDPLSTIAENDAHIGIHIVERQTSPGIWLNRICFFTLALVPTWYKTEYRVELSIDGASPPSRIYTGGTKLTTVVWLPLLPLTPIALAAFDHAGIEPVLAELLARARLDGALP